MQHFQACSDSAAPKNIRFPAGKYLLIVPLVIVPLLVLSPGYLVLIGMGVALVLSFFHRVEQVQQSGKIHPGYGSGRCIDGGISRPGRFDEAISLDKYVVSDGGSFERAKII